MTRYLNPAYVRGLVERSASAREQARFAVPSEFRSDEDARRYYHKDLADLADYRLRRELRLAEEALDYGVPKSREIVWAWWEQRLAAVEAELQQRQQRRRRA